MIGIIIDSDFRFFRYKYTKQISIHGVYMGLSIPHLLLLLAVVLVLFGAGRLPKVMGDLGKGLRSFKEGLRGEVDVAGRLEDKE
jgi:sec-independent protein translocase protein TatA